MVTLTRTQKPTDQTEVQHINLGFSIMAGSQGHSPATLVENLRQMQWMAWKIFLQKICFIYPSLCSLVFVSTNEVINCPGMQKCILRVQILSTFPYIPAHTTVMPSARKVHVPSPPTPEVLLPTLIFTENPVTSRWLHLHNSNTIKNKLRLAEVCLMHYKLVFPCALRHKLCDFVALKALAINQSLSTRESNVQFRWPLHLPPG